MRKDAPYLNHTAPHKNIDMYDDRYKIKLKWISERSLTVDSRALQGCQP